MSTVKLADFGMAKRMHEQLHGPNATTQRATMCGTPMYMAPEIVNKQPYTSKVDIWAAGVILYTLLTGSMPFHNKDQTELFAQIREGRFVMGGRRWTGISEEAQAFVKMLLDPDPDKRPSGAAPRPRAPRARPQRRADPAHAREARGGGDALSSGGGHVVVVGLHSLRTERCLPRGAARAQRRRR